MYTHHYTLFVWCANEEARRLGIDNSKPAGTLSKVVSIQISIGDSDRDRTVEEFIAEINKRLKPVPYGKDGIHASVMSGYYIVDGKVCMPSDFDEKKKNFRDKAVPPSWAGGPLPKKVTAKPAGESSTSSAAISAKAYDEKYGPEGSPVARGKIENQKELARKRREGPTDDELEELDLEWDEDDLMDEEFLEETAAKSQRAAAKKISIKRTPAKKTVPAKKVAAKKVVAPRKKVVVKKAASASPAPRKVVRKK